MRTQRGVRLGRAAASDHRPGDARRHGHGEQLRPHSPQPMPAVPTCLSSSGPLRPCEITCVPRGWSCSSPRPIRGTTDEVMLVPAGISRPASGPACQGIVLRSTGHRGMHWLGHSEDSDHAACESLRTVSGFTARGRLRTAVVERYPSVAHRSNAPRTGRHDVRRGGRGRRSRGR